MSSYSYSSSSMSYSSTRNGQTTGQEYQRESRTTPEGTTVRTMTRNLGEPPVVETQRFDAQGRSLGALATGAAGNEDRRIEDVTEQEREREEREREVDRLYRERMEEEYAKREGGA